MNIFANIMNFITSCFSTATIIAIIVAALLVLFYRNDEVPMGKKCLQYGIFLSAILIAGIALKVYVSNHLEYDFVAAILYCTTIIVSHIVLIAYAIKKAY